MTYLEEYEVRCVEALVKMTQAYGSTYVAVEQVLDSPDLEEKWATVAHPYCVEAIRDMAEYPTVALGWMMYVGMAMAHEWDRDWRGWSLKPDPYTYLRDLRGWDEMDEAIREDILGLNGEKYEACEALVRACAQEIYSIMRKEDVEPQTEMAYHVFIHSLRALYRIGISVELKRLGYKYEKVNY